MASLQSALRASFRLVTLLCATLFSGGHALAAESSAPAGELKIRVEGTGWGRADRDEIETLLRAVADELMPGAIGRRLPAIVVTHGAGDPITRFEKGPQGEYRVQLSASDRRWAQYAYQFGHEFCHILSNFDRHPGERKQNQWFEESLCETAGLYALRSMAVGWESAPPYANWRDYAPALRRYADQFLAEPHRQLPADTSLATWLANSRALLREDPYLRARNEVVANRLLALFEAAPGRWRALQYLNLDPSDARCDFPAYLEHWYGNAPAEQRDFLRQLLALLGVAAEPGAAAAAPAGNEFGRL